MSRVVHPIEQESYRILRDRVDLSAAAPADPRGGRAGGARQRRPRLRRPTWSATRRRWPAGWPRCAAGRRSSPTWRWWPPGSPAPGRRSSARSPNRPPPSLAGAAGLTRSAAAVRIALRPGRPGRGLGGRLRADRVGRAASPCDAAPGAGGRAAGRFRRAPPSPRRRCGPAACPPCPTSREKGGSAVAAAALNALLYAGGRHDRTGHRRARYAQRGRGRAVRRARRPGPGPAPVPPSATSRAVSSSCPAPPLTDAVGALVGARAPGTGRGAAGAHRRRSRQGRHPGGDGA